MVMITGIVAACLVGFCRAALVRSLSGPDNPTEVQRAAQQQSVSLVHDLAGGKAAETVLFGLDGATFEIDLSKKNASALRRVLTEFVEHGRRVRGGASPARKRNLSRAAVRTGPAPAVVREWAIGQRIPVSPRGRVAADVVARYETANP